MPDAVRILKDGAAGSTAADEGSTLGTYPLDGELDPLRDGVRCRFLDTKEGEEAVLLIHGMGVSSHMFTHGWNGNYKKDGSPIDALVTAGFRVVAMDARGHGLSDLPPHDRSSYGMKQVEEQIALLDHLGLDKVHVAGYSKGAEVAIKLTTTHPQRVKSVNVGGSGWSYERGWYEKGYARVNDPCDCPCCGGGGGYGCACFAMRYCCPCCAGCIAQCLVGEKPSFAAVAAASKSMDEILNVTEDDLKSIPVPVGAVWGSKDQEREYLERMQPVVPDFTMKVIPDEDHESAPDNPQYKEALVEFFTGVSTRGGAEAMEMDRGDDAKG